jgi:hypothetical protein
MVHTLILEGLSSNSYLFVPVLDVSELLAAVEMT